MRDDVGVELVGLAVWIVCCNFNGRDESGQEFSHDPPM